MLYVVGDRVRVDAPECPLLKYEGWTTAMGTVKRWRNGKVRVEIDGTASQDTEGHNCYADYAPEQLTLVTPAEVERISSECVKAVLREQKPRFLDRAKKAWLVLRG